MQQNSVKNFYDPIEFHQMVKQVWMHLWRASGRSLCSVSETASPLMIILWHYLPCDLQPPHFQFSDDRNCHLSTPLPGIHCPHEPHEVCLNEPISIPTTPTTATAPHLHQITNCSYWSLIAPADLHSQQKNQQPSTAPVPLMTISLPSAVCSNPFAASANRRCMMGLFHWFWQ